MIDNETVEHIASLARLNLSKDEIVGYTKDLQEILEILQKICENSIYSYQNQISNGFITIKTSLK